MLFDNVHRRHGEPCAVHHAPDIAVKPDVAEAGFACLQFASVFFVRIAHRGEFRMPPQRVIVKVHLGIDNGNRQSIVRFHNRQRINFH